MNVIIIAVVSVTAIGTICAVILSVASKIMYVKIDERIALLTNAMPGANCGACGFPGCSAYAAAIVSGDTKPNLCTPGGAQLLAKISEILGIEAGSIDAKTAFVHCSSDNKTHQQKMYYKGVQSCIAAKQLYGGQSACAFGCIGYGDCYAVCPSNAICMEDYGLARVITSLCTGCGLCVKACPNELISIESAGLPVLIACNNIEKGAVARKKCITACIACGKCVRECPDKAIVIEENLAKIDYSKCTGCGHCVEVCVTKCIKKVTTPHIA
ncbi:MAG: RnfABCDGE type electron transport complex subunit B [Treponema sp.]|nr:RnfABCDGE type electron transport complex subunit B [Treponema sp.]MCL2252664.1 RnfABCDGE type electron transport complex subunit B [Treponema sp.]